MSDTPITLTVVDAYYLDPNGNTVQALPENRLLASDVAPKWNAWRQAAKAQFGWELFLSPPNSGTYTRAMFRTPADEQYLASTVPQNLHGATVDSTPHQAGRAVDLDLAGMANQYDNYSYTALVNLAKAQGMFNRVYTLTGTEPWHFDDNPASIFGTMAAAVEAVGNTLADYASDAAAGLPSPQAAAVQTWLSQNGGKAALVILGLGLATVAGIWAATHSAAS